MTMVIDGIGTVPIQTKTEYTNGVVANTYYVNMATIKEILDKRASNPGEHGTLSATDYNLLVQALQNLQNLALNGAYDPVTKSQGYLLTTMGQNLELVIKSLSTVGITASSSLGISDADKIMLMENWQSLAGYGIEQILIDAITSASTATRSLQSMVELEYVKQGNDLIYGQLGSLESALETTNGILETLDTIEGISNQIKVSSKGNYKFPPSTNADLPPDSWLKIRNDDDSTDSIKAAYDIDSANANNYMASHPGVSFNSAFAQFFTFAAFVADAANGSLTKFTQFYRISASIQFSQVFPTANPTSTAANELIQAKNTLMQQLVALEGQAGQATRSVVNSLAYFIYNVALDISAAFTAVGYDPNQLQQAVSNWIVDNMDQKAGTTESDSAGDIQERIKQAITSAESLNDSQKQEVQRYMFIFEQFYKSSSAVLTKVSQMIERMAQGISR